MPNPSTITAELEQEYKRALARAATLSLSKSAREEHLREARRLAAELGIEGPPPINGRPAQSQAQVHRLELTSEQLRMTQRALLLARDTAFLTVGDKDHEIVKGWEMLRKVVAYQVK
jgi:DNA-binding NarL/FixJ family response regulator